MISVISVQITKGSIVAGNGQNIILNVVLIFPIILFFDES